MAFAQGTSSEVSVLQNSEFEYKMLAHYFNIHKLPCMINSPIRGDKSPSFQLYSSSMGHVRWRDYGTGETGDIWLLLAKYWNIPIKEAQARVVKDVSRISSHEHSVEVIPTTFIKGKVVYGEETNLKVKIREWKDYDLSYWESYGISKPWLEFGNVYPISHVIITKGTTTHIISAEKYAYVFVEYKDNIPSLKVYQPYSKSYKWTNKHDRSVWDLWAQLPNIGEKLIITSSRKDALCVWENTGIPCVSLQGEGYIPKPHVMSELIKRFKTIYVLYDNDFRSEVNYGHEYGKKLAETFGLKQIEIPTHYHRKDPSDLCQAHGRATLKQVIFGLVNQRITEDDCPF